jgi:predicted helicase
MSLYLNPSVSSQGKLSQERQPNLAPGLLDKLSAAYGFSPTPEEVLGYIYAVLYSPTYRRRYAEALRVNFPRVPFTADAGLFRQMAALGQELIALHLFRSPKLPSPVAKYQGLGGHNKVEQIKYEAKTNKVWTTPTRYFEGITSPMWNYQIGGYPVLAKYLKDRKGRYLDDAVHYLRIATAIYHTIALHPILDEVYAQVEEAEKLAFSLLKGVSA